MVMASPGPGLAITMLLTVVKAARRDRGACAARW
jgi:hypothetical protein